MSWDQTYSHSVAIGLDEFGAAIFLNRPGITISSICRVVQLADFAPGIFGANLRQLKLSQWQVYILRHLGRFLDWLQPGHCEAARLGDLARGGRNQALLTEPPAPTHI